MWFFSWLFSICTTMGNICVKYARGFTTAEILEKRMDVMQTTIFTILIISGFKPIFKLITNIVIFGKDLILGLFFPQKKLQDLEVKNAKQEYLEKKLLKELAKINETQRKINAQIQKQMQKWLRDKRKKTPIKRHSKQHAIMKKLILLRIPKI
ncbi:MAG: hypothetical protein Q8888_02135 [Vigna little leaf phytoplasma]|nr:hypothetical protein [Vigna little leaf phytoplasma]